MAVKNLNELFEHELKDIYYAEHRLLEALEELASETKHREAKKAYTSHRRETQGQIKRLQKVFKLFGEVPEAEKCPGIEGLLKEKHNFTRKEKPSQEILDYFNMTAAIKTEHYEICAYEGLIEIARQLGMEQAVELLAQNLSEEQATSEKLQTLSREYDTASLMGDEEEEDEEPKSGRGATAGGSKSASKGGAKGAGKSASKSAGKSASKSTGKAASKSTGKSASKSAGKSATPAQSSKAVRGGASKTAASKTAGRKSGPAADTGLVSGAPDDAMYPQTLNDTV